ncbi:MAG: hypothetical protein A2172_02445 [Candidatus Woykebacteria bacterium RBG_13_40_15]|uniref:Dockerin domain-containing protein n=1 Tax=Candidatus Woykebacteria bacterium RBG_13_40_15 TaxID=1802593 RepID=A0A1G1W6A3_9BACT|nr:MAG: hypothetical protein A2172_02445 [Candidatus Woykebacteria bacterium RBG_13_40_15]
MIKKLTCSLLIVSLSFVFCLVQARAADVTVTGTVPPTTVTLSGRAPASSTITIREDGSVVATTVTSVAGTFIRTITSTSGLHNYSLTLVDTAGRSTPATNFNNITLPAHGDTPISNILMPPTIALSKNTIYKGDSTLIYGQASSGSTVHVILNGSQKFSGVVSGSSWQFTLSSGYNFGNNSIYAYLTRAGYANSVNSYTLNLKVNNCRRSDLNCDGFVNLTDFSILLYHWGTNHAIGDINGDGTVGLIDFSIMMFDWTG